MPEIEDFLPIFPEEDEESVLNRMLEWLNDGVAQGSPEWIDPREGGMARTLLVPAAREIATLYDRISVEFPAAATPLFAWGTYLDQWAEVVGTRRLVATYAGGMIEFTAEEGTVFPLGTEVGVDPDIVAAGTEAPSYLTTEAVTVPVGETTVEVMAVATEPGVFGNVAASAVTFFLSSPPDEEATVTNPDAMVGGTDEESDEALRERVLGIYSATPGGGNVDDYVRWVRSVPGVGGVSVMPEAQGPGTVSILATSPTGDPVSEEVRLAIRDYLDPVQVQTAASAVTASTITVASTAGFSFGAIHMGPSVDSLTLRTHQFTSKSSTQFMGVTPAPTFTTGDVVWQTGSGHGRAPVGHHVMVFSAVAFPVTLTASLVLDAGYALGGGPSTVDLVPALNAAARAYIDSLVPNEKVIYDSVVAAIMGVQGVYDINTLLINGVSVNVTPTMFGVPMLEATPTWSAV